jgi:hypothetical protein
VTQPPEGAKPPSWRRWSWRVWAFAAIALVWAITAAVSSHQRGIAVTFAVVAALLAVNAGRGSRPPT